MFPKNSSGVARKRMVFLLGALLAVNAAVAHIVTTQIAAAQGDKSQVKDDQVVVEEATELSADEAPSDEEESDSAPAITIYTVKSGDTISGIASKFHISSNTIRWANEIPASGAIKVGQALVILPINGIQYTVKSGDTISGIAAKFDADAQEILYFNDLDDPKAIKPGLDLIIPDAEPVVAKKPVSKPATAAAPKPAAKSTELPQSAFQATDTHEHEDESKESTNNSDENSGSEDKKNDEPAPAPTGRYGIFVVPAPGSVLTQGYHAINAVDFGGKSGTPIVAAAKGTVIVAKSGCPLDGSMRSRCNGGFGNFIVISHDNGVQTLYAHLSKVSVTVGDSVDQGEKIGGMGDSGKSTGTHLHFETHNMKNPFTKDKKYTQY